VNTKKIFASFDFAIDLTLIIITSIIFYLSQEIKVQKVQYIPNGSINKIVSYLNKKSYNLNKFDSIILRFFPHIKKGWIDLGTNKMSLLDFYVSLTYPKTLNKNIVLFPGETNYFFLKSISKVMRLDFDLLLHYYENISPKKDGVIIADTYKYPFGSKENFIINDLVKKSMKIHMRLAKKYLGRYQESEWFRYVSIASMIQKEAANKEEMPYVSSVIHNRIKKHMKLQIDGALNYGKFSHTRVTKKMIRTDKSKYNTYRHYGVPPNPIASVSIEAIKAAIFPKKTDYLYFVMDRDIGTHIFSRSYKNHIYNIKTYGQRY
jgi:UPF0755 protein